MRPDSWRGAMRAAAVPARLAAARENGASARPWKTLVEKSSACGRQQHSVEG